MNDEELESHFSLGRLYAREQRFERAGPHFAAVLGVTPTDENKWMMGPAALGLSQCLATMGRMDEARKYLDKAATLAPELKPEVERLLHALPAGTAS
jgi:tetratricopeptide (TPR) repeat protein